MLSASHLTTSVSQVCATFTGAIVGLTLMGHQAVRNALFPNLHLYLNLLQTAIHNSNNEMKRFEGCKCFGALLHAVGMAMRDLMKCALCSSFI